MMRRERGLAGYLGEALRASRVALAAGIAVSLVLPWWLSGYWMRVVTSAFMFGALAQSVNIIAGFGGRADFGNVVYFGLGAYATGFLLGRGVSLPFAVFAGAVLAAAVAGLVGLPILRLKGHYFAIATIGLLEGTREVFANIAFLGGGAGMNIPLLPMEARAFSMLVYFVMLGFMIAYSGIAWVVSRSGFGYGLRAIKADEEAAAAMGVDVVLQKVLAWSISAACSAAVGGMYAVWQSYIEPRMVFDVVMGTQYFMMMLLGGPGTVLGPVIGALALHIIGVLVWSKFLHGHLAVLGIAMVLIVLFLPRGLVAALATVQGR